jgi:hypothetical protein
MKKLLILFFLLFGLNTASFSQIYYEPEYVYYYTPSLYGFYLQMPPPPLFAYYGYYFYNPYYQNYYWYFYQNAYWFGYSYNFSYNYNSYNWYSYYGPNQSSNSNTQGNNGREYKSSTTDRVNQQFKNNYEYKQQPQYKIRSYENQYKTKSPNKTTPTYQRGNTTNIKRGGR